MEIRIFDILWQAGVIDDQQYSKCREVIQEERVKEWKPYHKAQKQHAVWIGMSTPERWKRWRATGKWGWNGFEHRDLLPEDER